MFRDKLIWPLMAACMLGLVLAACGEEEAPIAAPTITPVATALPSPPATGTPGALPSPTEQVGPGQPPVLDLAASELLLTIFAIDEGDLRNDMPALAVGDFNDDGMGDLLLGARFGDGADNSRADAGDAYVIFGPHNLAGTVDLATGEQDLSIFGAKPGDNLGYSVAAADVNDDGVDDIIVSAPLSEGPPEYRTDRGEVYVIFGRPGLGGTIDIAEGQQDVTVLAAEGFSLLGDSIATCDANDDGIDDIVLGAPFAGRVPGSPQGGPRTELGEVYVIFGSATLSGTISIPQGQQDFTISGPEQFSELGDALACGDVNGDGKDDIIAVAEAADGPGGARPNAGEAYVVFGSADLSGRVDIAQEQQDVTILGATAHDALGYSAASGDIDGDDIDDIILVAQRGDGPDEKRSTAGEAYVIFGSPGLRGTIDILSGDQDLTIFGAAAHDLLSSCTAGGDLNGDGLGDIVLGTSFANPPQPSRERAGEAYVIFGSPDLEAVLDLAQGIQDLTILGADADDGLGSSVRAGDLDGDGVDELIVVAASADGPENARADAGEVYVITGIGGGQ